jgi:hypothetical protein
LFLPFGSAQATSLTRSAEDVNALEAIYLGPLNSYQEGQTTSGVRYIITRTQSDPAYSNRYISYGSLRDTVRIQFDQPMSAVGADILISAFTTLGNYNEVGGSGSMVCVGESGYYGVVAEGGGIHEVTFVTDSGPLEISRLDLRPAPVAADDTITTYQNASRGFDPGTILTNDKHVEAVLLVSPPSHADLFELHVDGSMAYRPAKNFCGEDSFTYRVTNGNGASVSLPASVTLKVLQANCPPSFSKGADVVCIQNCGPQTMSAWATNLSAGPEQESTQHLTWEISTDNTGLFASLPSLDEIGTLCFEPAYNASGVATVTARLRDDGSTENFGQDASETQTFTITVQAVEQPPLLESIFDCVVRQGDTLSIRARTRDGLNQAEFSLEEAPPGATIEPATGRISWVPQNADPEQLHQFVVKATTLGPERLASTASFNVEVLAPPRPPRVLAIADQKAKPGVGVRLKIAAHPNGNLRYSLAKGSEGAAVNPKTGMFYWKPKVASAGRSYRFAVAVADADVPGLTTVRTFAVHVGKAIFFAHRPARRMIAKAKSKVYLARAPGETAGHAAMIIGTPARAKAK